MCDEYGVRGMRYGVWGMWYGVLDFWSLGYDVLATREKIDSAITLKLREQKAVDFNCSNTGCLVLKFTIYTMMAIICRCYGENVPRYSNIFDVVILSLIFG